MHKIGSICLVSLFSFQLYFAQSKLDHYTPLQSRGPVPEDFSTMANTKVTQDLELKKTKLSRYHESAFLEGIHYAVNELLHSGLVTYGDEVSQYVRRIADTLLKNEPALANELRFYVLKSNEVNAFSTYQGIIFVTTGLISRLENEAQLAFILSHEIIHYTNNHVIEQFKWNKQKTIDKNYIRDLSNYSKAKEFEADQQALDRYHKAGYGLEYAISALSMLEFAHLPFENKKLPLDFFNATDLEVPSWFFEPDTTKNNKNDVISKEAEEFSSHPDVAIRKDSILNRSVNYQKWGERDFIVAADTFRLVKQICQLEAARINCIDGNYEEALYTIFLLKEQFPNSIYLKRLEAKIWLNLVQLKRWSLLDDVEKTKNPEIIGEAAMVSAVLQQFSEFQLATVALANLNDLYQDHPEDKMIVAAWDRLLEILPTLSTFELTAFKARPVDTMESKALARLREINHFHEYSISGLLQKEYFQETYDKNEDRYREWKQKEKKFNALPARQRNEIREKELKMNLNLGLDSLLCLDPRVFSFYNDNWERKYSEELEHEMVGSFDELGKSLGMQLTTLSYHNLADNAALAFNEQALLKNLFTELYRFKEIDVFPTDFMEIEEIRSKYKSNEVLFTFLIHIFTTRAHRDVIATVLIPPVALGAIPAMIVRRNHINLSLMVMDLKNHQCGLSKDIYYREPIDKYFIKVHIYDVLNQLKSTAK